MIDLRLGDCLEVMKTLPDKSVDAVITDPPYGINFIKGGGRSPNCGWRTFYNNQQSWDKQRPSAQYFQEILRVGKNVIIWGGNYFTDYLPPSQQWLVWDKGQRDFSLADAEIAWSNQDKAIRVYSYSRGAMVGERVEHPTQKPVALMKWCISLIVGNADTILDPFMGSGTTGVACAQTGRNFIGIEINPVYFEMAKKRIEEAQLQIMMPL